MELQKYQGIFYGANDQNASAVTTPASTMEHICVMKNDSVLTARRILLPFVSSAVVLANLAVVISSGLILRNGREPRVTYLFLGNIAMADLLTAIVIIIEQAIPKEIWYRYTCILFTGLVVSTLLSSVFSVGLIAIDRYIYILHGLQYNRRLNSKRARIIICLVWVFSCNLGFLPITLWSREKEDVQCCWFVTLARPELVIIVVSIAFVPLIGALIIYAIILYCALKNIKRLTSFDEPGKHSIESGENYKNMRMFRGRSDTISTSSNTDLQEQPNNMKKRMIRERCYTISMSLNKDLQEQHNNMKNSTVTPKKISPSKCRAIKVVFFTAGCCCITIGPFLLGNLTFALVCDKKLEDCQTITTLLKCPLALMLYFNGILNPIIYAWWHKGFREFVKLRLRRFITNLRSGKSVRHSCPARGHPNVCNRTRRSLEGEVTTHM